MSSAVPLPLPEELGGPPIAVVLGRRGLGAIPVGAFADAAVARALHCAAAEEPVYLIAVGAAN